MKWNSFALFLALLQAVKGQQISGYGPVDEAELNPLTLNWNQVSFNPILANFLVILTFPGPLFGT